jgi:hypothetical protein
MSASVKSIEDHGYILNLGVPEVSGFLSFKDAKKSLESSKTFCWRIVDVSVLENVEQWAYLQRDYFSCKHKGFPCMFTSIFRPVF